MGHVPVVGRREGELVLALFLLGSVARKCVARQVRWDTLLHEGEGQMSVLAPEVGMAEEQRVQVWGPAKRDFDFSSWGFRGACVTSRA